MQVLSINNFYKVNYKNNSNKLKKEENNNIIYNTNYKSIYKTGFGQINFLGGVSSFTKEIAEQPIVIKNILDSFFKNSEKISGINISIPKKELLKASAINIIASGSSKNSGEMAKAFMEKVTDMPVNIFSASEFMTSKPRISNKDIMIFVSQSGNTADTFEALQFAKENGNKTIALTNKRDSKISNGADFYVEMQAGVENAVAATKTVTSSILNLWGIGMKLGEIKDTFSLKDLETLNELRSLPEKIESMIKDRANIHEIAKKYANKDNIYILTKEPNVGAANEGALKLTETTQKRVISGSSSEFMHGLFTSIKPEDLLVEIATDNTQTKNYQLAKENFQEIINKRNVKDAILFINNDNKEALNEIKGIDFITIPNTLPEFTPLLNTVRLQQLTEGFTKALNINPDNGGGILTKYRSNLTMNSIQ